MSRITLIVRSLLAAALLLAAFASSAAAQDPACDTTWNGTTATYGDGSKWDHGFPTASQRACLPAGSYTVTVTGGNSPKGITVGAGVTLVIKDSQYIDARSASFINHGTVRLEANATLYGPLVNDGTVEDTGTIPAGNNRPNLNGAVTNTGTIRANQGLNIFRGSDAITSTGRLETANADALLNGVGNPDGTITLGGTIVNPGTMQFQSGTMQVRAITSQTGNPFRTYTSKLDLTGAASGASVEALYGVELATDIPAGVTVTVMARSTEGQLQFAANRTNNGTLVLDSADVNQRVQLSSLSGIPRLTNAGTVRLKATTNGDRLFSIPFTNTGTITVDAGARLYLNGDGDLRASTSSGTITINGSWWTPRVNSTLTQTAGTLAIAGSMLWQGGSYIHQGGTITGEVQLGDNASVDASGPGTATYRVVGVATLAGNVNANATITLESNNSTQSTLYLGADRTVAGRLVMTSTGQFAQDTAISSSDGAYHRLTVSGRLEAEYGTFGGARNLSLITLAVMSAGTVNVGANARLWVSGNGATSASTLAGTVNVVPTGTMLWRISGQTITQTGGTITASGGFVVEANTFVHQGGTVSGWVTMSSAKFDPSGPGAVTYDIVNSVTLIGDVNADATVQLKPTNSYGSTLYLVDDRTLAGRITMTNAATYAQDTTIASADGGFHRLTVTGRLEAENGTNGGARNISLVPLTLTSTGTVSVGENAKLWMSGNGSAYASSLAGTVNVAAAGTMLWRIAGQTVTQTAGTITASGAFVVEANTFVHQGGTIAGDATISSSGSVDPSGPGTASYLIAGSANLIGGVNADASIDVGSGTTTGALYVQTRDVTNRGTIDLGPASSPLAALYDNGQPYTLTNAGTLRVSPGGDRTNNVRLINTGTYTVNASTTGISAIDDKPLITNAGGTVTVNAAGLTTWRGYTQTSGLTDMTNASIGSPRNPADIRIDGGRLRGTGVLYGPVTNGATIEVGRPGGYGKLEIKDVVDQIVRVAASYTQQPLGRLAIDVGGKVAGTSFDQLSVDGPVTLDGALDVTTAAGYTPTPTTDTFRAVLAESRSGTFANLTGGRYYTLTHDATGALLTGRVPPPPTGELSIGSANVREGAGPLTFTVTLSKAATDPVTVAWTTEDDTATAGADYTASSGTLTFPAGSTSQTISVPVVNDNVVEPLKQLLVRLRNPVNGTLEVATGVGTIEPDEVGITTAAPNSVGIDGNATIVVNGGGFAAGTTAKLTRAGSADRVGTITSGPDRQSKFSARFDMRGAVQGQWLLVVTTPNGTATAPITVRGGAAALSASLSMPSSLRYGWVATAVLSVRNAGGNDVTLDGVRFSGSDLELRAPGTTTFAPRVTLTGTQLGDAEVIPALTTRTVLVELRSTTLVGHAFMKLDAELYPSGTPPVVAGSDPDPGKGSITGHVTTASGQPARGLRVTAWDGAHSASAVTDGSGAYTLSPLKPGTYAVEAADAKGSAALNENARTVDLVTGVADLSGTTGKGDATVALLQDGAAVASVPADASGGFRFRVAKPGAYTIVADSPTAGRASRAVTVAAGVDQPGLSLTFGTRTLTVTTVAGAIVSVYPAAEAAVPSRKTATGSSVSFPGMPAGALTVEARAVGKALARTTTSANAVTVTPGAGGTVSGKVTQAGVAVAGAVVVASAGGESRTVVTGDDGRYALAGLTGAQDVWVLAPGAAPLVKRGVVLGSTSADAAVLTTGATLDVKVGTGAVGRLVELVDPATGVTIAATGTSGPDGLAHLGPLPAGTFAVRASGAGTQSVTVGSAKAARAAADGNVTLDDDGYPVVEDPEHDPAYDEYTSPFSGLKAPQLNEKDRLGWDQVDADYPGPCPTADRLIDTIHLKQRAKLAAFSAWVEAWNAVDDQNRADVEKLATISAQFAANSFLALATLGKAPEGMSYAAAGALGNLANYIGTFTQQQMGLLDPLTAVDHAQYFKDTIDTLVAFDGEYGGPGTELSYLSTVINIVRSMIDLNDQARAFANDVAERGNAYLDAQGKYEQLLREINDLLNAYAEARKHCPELVDRGPKAPVSSGGRIENITANDPNEIWGPAGVGAQGFIPRSQALGYSIRFENLGPGSVVPPGQQPASAPATIVKVVTTLAAAVDIDQVTLGNVGWGAVELSVPTGLTSYHTDIPQSDGDIVRVDGALNKSTRAITWTLKTIDPSTGEVDGSPAAGFLAPEDGTRRGQGHVDYRAGSAESVADGASIAAQATITFDVNAPISTNTHANTVDGGAPAATLTAGTPSCDGKIPVSWSGTDGGSGVTAYDVQVAKVGGGWEPWLAGIGATSATYAGTPGTTYAFRVQARDAVGNQETAPSVADATVAFAPCDLVPPRTTATLPAGAVGGWYSGPVDVKLDAVDAPGGSGVTALRVQGTDVNGSSTTTRVSAEGVTDFVFAARDAKGNVEADAHVPVRIDTTAPVIAGSDGLSFALGQAAAPDASCSDAASGVASCDVPGVLSTAAAGTFGYTVTASDKLGHTASRTFAYSVVAPTPQPGGGGGGTTPPPSTGPAFGKAPVTVKLGKVTKTAVALTLTSKETFAFTGTATLLTAGKKPKAQSKTASFSLKARTSGKLTLKLNAAGKKALKGGKKVKLVLRLQLQAGTARKAVDIKVTVRAR